jgi:subtilase family serine protease
MKIYQLLSGMHVPLSNQEQQFVEKYSNKVSLNSLNEQDKWLAQNLVRKGFYSISKDSNTLIKNINELSS